MVDDVGFREYNFEVSIPLVSFGAQEVDCATDLFHGRANKHGGALETGNEDGYEFLQESRVLLGCNVQFEVVLEGSCGLKPSLRI